MARRINQGVNQDQSNSTRGSKVSNGTRLDNWCRVKCGVNTERVAIARALSLMFDNLAIMQKRWRSLIYFVLVVF